MEDGRPGKRVALKVNVTVLGASPMADIRLAGWLIKDQHAVITNDAGKYCIKRVGGGRPVRVNGRPVVEYDLKNSDSIKIGANEFRFFDALA